MVDFVNNFDLINMVVENSLGFIWCLKDDFGNVISIFIFNDFELIVNMLVWQDVVLLKQFMFKIYYIDFLKCKKEWFVFFDSVFYVMWWIEEGYILMVVEVEECLFYFCEYGESDYVFSFKYSFNKQNGY